MTTMDEKYAGVQQSGRFTRVRTIAGRGLRRGPGGPPPLGGVAPVRKLAPPPPPTGDCNARWCLAHDHSPKPRLVPASTRPRLALASAPAIEVEATPVADEMPLDATNVVETADDAIETTPA